MAPLPTKDRPASPKLPPKPKADAPPPLSPVTFGPVPDGAGHRVAIYGPGGIGKTSLAAMAPGPVAFFDLDGSLPVLADQLPEMDIRPVECPPTWAALRDALHAPGWGEIATIVIDSATRAEELCAEWVIANVPHEKNNVTIKRIEDYGWGKGYTHIYETFLRLLGDLDQHARAGRNVVLVMHDCTANVPNPAGEDFIRFEPRLQSPPSGKASVRLRVREWVDHLLFVGYDVVAEDRKGKGTGTRTIYPTELPHCMAKSRSIADPIPFVRNNAYLWSVLMGQAADGEPTEGEA